MAEEEEQREPTKPAEIYTLLQDFISYHQAGFLSKLHYEAGARSSLFALPKPNGGLRPIVVCCRFLALMDRAIRFNVDFSTTLGPQNVGCGTPNGGLLALKTIDIGYQATRQDFENKHGPLTINMVEDLVTDGYCKLLDGHLLKIQELPLVVATDCKKIFNSISRKAIVNGYRASNSPHISNPADYRELMLSIKYRLHSPSNPQ